MDKGQMEALEEMLAETKSEVLLKRSFGMFQVNRKNMRSRIVLGLLSAVLAFWISMADTVVILGDVTAIILDTALAIFGVVFTGYALFQALLTGRLVSVLVEDVSQDAEKIQTNTLHKTNWNFVQLMMQFLVAIFVTLILKIILSCMPTDFSVFRQWQPNVILSAVLIFIYFYHLAVILWRMVSFIFNIYQLFNSYAVSKYLSFVKRGEEED